MKRARISPKNIQGNNYYKCPKITAKTASKPQILTLVNVSPSLTALNNLFQ